MRRLILAALFGCVLAASAEAQRAARDPAAPAPPPVLRTGKERLGDKASDEQRVDDCKVPRERRTRPRPASCRWDPMS